MAPVDHNTQNRTNMNTFPIRSSKKQMALASKILPERTTVRHFSRFDVAKELVAQNKMGATTNAGTNFSQNVIRDHTLKKYNDSSAINHVHYRLYLVVHTSNRAEMTYDPQNYHMFIVEASIMFIVEKLACDCRSSPNSRSRRFLR